MKDEPVVPGMKQYEGWPLSHQPGRSPGKDGAGKVTSPLCGPQLLRVSRQRLWALEGHYSPRCAGSSADL